MMNTTFPNWSNFRWIRLDFNCEASLWILCFHSIKTSMKNGFHPSLIESNLLKCMKSNQHHRIGLVNVKIKLIIDVKYDSIHGVRRMTLFWSTRIESNGISLPARFFQSFVKRSVVNGRCSIDWLLAKENNFLFWDLPMELDRISSRTSTVGKKNVSK